MVSIEADVAEGISPAEPLLRRSSHDTDIDKSHGSERVDRELAQYVSGARIEISPERSTQLRRMIDRRVLVVMMVTYFLQTLDKGTLSFASIMGILEDTGMANPDGSARQTV
jgi:hypothetical protein